MVSPKKRTDGLCRSPLKHPIAAKDVEVSCSTNTTASRICTNMPNNLVTISKPRKTLHTIFINKKFYLDLKPKTLNSAVFQQLVVDLKTLGGTIETFFSRDVTTVISDAPESKLKNIVSQRNRAVTPGTNVCTAGPNTPGGLAPSPCTSVSLPGAANSPWSPLSVEEAKKIPIVRSRGEAILDRARKQNVRDGSSVGSVNPGGQTVLDIAMQWGQQIWSLSKLFNWLDDIKKRYSASRRAMMHQQETPPTATAARAAFVQTRSQSVDSGLQMRLLEAPYIKFEVTNHLYRPVYQEFEKFPKIYLCGRPGSSPFTTPEALKQKSRQRLKETRNENRTQVFNQQRILEVNNRPVTQHFDAQQQVGHAPQPVVMNPVTNRRHHQNGFCEICECPFTDLYEHLSTKIHQHKVAENELWAKLDVCINKVNTNGQSEEEEFDPQFSF